MHGPVNLPQIAKLGHVADDIFHLTVAVIITAQKCDDVRPGTTRILLKQGHQRVHPLMIHTHFIEWLVPGDERGHSRNHAVIEKAVAMHGLTIDLSKLILIHAGIMTAKLLEASIAKVHHRAGIIFKGVDIRDLIIGVRQGVADIIGHEHVVPHSAIEVTAIEDVEICAVERSDERVFAIVEARTFFGRSGGGRRCGLDDGDELSHRIFIKVWRARRDSNPQPQT